MKTPFLALAALLPALPAAAAPIRAASLNMGLTPSLPAASARAIPAAAAPGALASAPVSALAAAAIAAPGAAEGAALPAPEGEPALPAAALFDGASAPGQSPAVAASGQDSAFQRMAQIFNASRNNLPSTEELSKSWMSGWHIPAGRAPQRAVLGSVRSEEFPGAGPLFQAQFTVPFVSPQLPLTPRDAAAEAVKRLDEFTPPRWVNVKPAYGVFTRTLLSPAFTYIVFHRTTAEGRVRYEFVKHKQYLVLAEWAPGAQQPTAYYYFSAPDAARSS